MNVRLILGVLGGIVAAEFIAIIVQLNIYKREVDKSIEYENFRKEVLIKAAKERKELREALAKQQELKNKMEELREKRSANQNKTNEEITVPKSINTEKKKNEKDKKEKASVAKKTTNKGEKSK